MIIANTRQISPNGRLRPIIGKPEGARPDKPLETFHRVDQLPSVRLGQVLADIIATRRRKTPASVAKIDPERTELGEQSTRVWTEFIDDYLKLDDPESRSQGQHGWATSPSLFRELKIVFRCGRPAWFVA